MELGADYGVRPATAADEAFLRAMLYEAVYTPPGHARPARAIVHAPALAKYVDHWGGPDDLGWLAVLLSNHQPVGAAWLRRLTRANPGYGYIDDATPEVSIAVAPEYRGQGIGTALLRQLLATAAGRFPAVSLSVDPGNPAVALYQRLGFQRVGVTGTSLTMRCDLTHLERPLATESQTTTDRVSRG